MSGIVNSNRPQEQDYRQLEGQRPLPQEELSRCTTCHKVICFLTCALLWGGGIVSYYLAYSCQDHNYTFINCNNITTPDARTQDVAQQLLFPFNVTKAD